MSALIAYLFTRIHLVPIAGFLLTGVVVGPNALGLVQDPELVDTLATIGVVLLLFEIGIEFSLEKLARLKRAIGLGGGLQVGLTIAVVTGIGLAAGVGLGASVYTGALIALSSTAVVLGLLGDRGETDTPTGQLSLSILIFQDLAIVAMVLLVPMLAGVGGSALDIAKALGLAILVIGVTLVLARIVVPRVLDAVAHTRRTELFVLVVAAIGLGTAWLVSLAGVSLELGAFLAGLVVSESGYSEQALSEVLPFRSIFNAIFFVSVGMLLDLSFLLQEPLLMLGAIGGVLLLKALVTTGAVLALGSPVRVAVAVGFTLAQVGEFSFVLERAGRAVGLSPFGLGAVGEQAFIVTAVILMLVTPGLLRVGPPLGRRLQALTGKSRNEEETPGEAADDQLEDHVIVVGYGPVGRRLAQVLDECDIPFVVIDINPESIDEAQEAGYEAFYGDATRSAILKEAGVQRAKLCVVAINDQDAARRITRVARHENPTIQLLVRTRFLTDLGPLREAGADVVVPEELEASVQIFSHVLRSYMVPQPEIDEKVTTIRTRDYALLREDGELHHLLLQGLDEDGLHTRVVRLRKECAAEGRRLGDLRLQQDHDLSVLAVHRDDETISSPTRDVRLYAGDRLVVMGSAEAFAESADLFRVPDPVVEEAGRTA
jgi:CPA2 family monovalent cation:H+ antiporter-2